MEQMARIWMITCEKNGFRYTIFLNATEERLQKYMKTEITEAIKYSGATEKDVEAARILHLPIYLY